MVSRTHGNLSPSPCQAAVGDTDPLPCACLVCVWGRLECFMNVGSVTEPKFEKVAEGNPDPTDGLKFDKWARWWLFRDLIVWQFTALIPS